MTGGPLTAAALVELVVDVPTRASIATTSVYAAAADDVAQQIAAAVSLRLPPLTRNRGETT